MECGRIWCLQGTGATAETMSVDHHNMLEVALAVQLLFTLSKVKVGWRLMTVHGSGCAVGCREHSQRRGTDRRALRHDKACQDPGVFFREHWLSAHDLVAWESQQLGFQILSDPVRLLARGISLDISRSTSLRDKGGLQCFPTAAGDGEQAPATLEPYQWLSMAVSSQVVVRDSGGSRLRRSRNPQLCQRKREEHTVRHT